MIKNLTLSSLIARLPTDVIVNHYPLPTELGNARYQSSNYYFGAIRAMLLDEEVASDIEMRHATAMTVPYVIEGSTNDVAFYNDVMADFDLEMLMEQMLSATEFGFMPVELIWEKDGSLLRLSDSEQKRPEDFRLLKDGTLVYSAVDYTAKTPVTGKVIPVLRNATTERPYGETILESVWPIWQSKWISWANIERLGEKYAIPTAIALAQDANGGSDLQRIADSLAPVMNGDAVALSGVKEIVTLDANGKVDELLRTIEYIDNKISKRITGQTLTGSNQKYGSRSLGEVHERAAMRVSKRDARMVHKTLNNTLFKWIFLANGRQGNIKIRVDEEAYKAMLESALANGSGVEPVLPSSHRQGLEFSNVPGKHLCLL